MNKTASIIVTIGLVIGIGVIVFGQSASSRGSDGATIPPNVEVREGVQYVTINARGGYAPKVSVAQADIPTKLIVQTNNTYDCSAALVIHSIGYQKMLSPTGEEVIDIGTPQEGVFQGTCSMGMYRFEVKFRGMSDAQ